MERVRDNGRRRWLPLAAAAGMAALSACATKPPPPAPAPAVHAEVVVETGWRDEVTAEDEARIAGLAETWRGVLETVPRRFRRLVEAEGELLAADAARDRPETPPGSYNCRLVKLGAEGRAAPVRGFPPFFCYIRAESGNRLSFTKQTGTELPGGWLHADEEQRRLVLVGARQRRAGDNSLLYGDEPDRDLVGVIERIGPFRWRLVLPWRAKQPGLDVYELTPVPLERQAEEPRPSD